VPFGEYMPLRDIFFFKKITHGAIDYTQGKREIVALEQYNLKILPLVCYESIFPFEVMTSNQDADLIVNVTNDAWYGHSSGPYQHFEISRLRAVENGLPMIRSGNNGISAIIDPLGRVISKLGLDEVDILDNYLPKKLDKPTIFSQYGYITIIILLILVLILQGVISIILNFILEKLKRS
jgi:apolipoprotein N-acyltransferase